MVIQNIAFPTVTLFLLRFAIGRMSLGLTELRLIHIQIFDYLNPHIKLSITNIFTPGLVQICPL